MNNFFEKKNLEKLWWYGLNIITTLFIVSFVNFNAPQGPAGSPGSNGVNGVDGQDGQDGAASANIYPVSAIQYEEAPAGAARAAYAQARIAEGYIPISSLEDLAVFTTNPNGSIEDGYYGNETAYDRKYVLTADLDFFGEDINAFYPYMIPGFVETPDESYDVYFRGVFDGAGYSIKNFELYRGEWNYHVGFFPYTADAIIQNITFENLVLKAALFAGSAGGVIGYVDGPTLLVNVQLNNLTVISDGNAGGVVGYTYDSLTMLNVNTNLGVVHGDNSSGGFIGTVEGEYHTIIQDSSNRLNVDSETDILNLGNNSVSSPEFSGGFIGFVNDVQEVSILNSFNSGLVRSGGNTGGFIGQVYNSRVLVIANSYNTGTIISNDGNEGAGFIADLESHYPIYIQNSFNAGTIIASAAMGGFVGELSENDFDIIDSSPLYITNSYNAGLIASLELGDERGGFVGEVRWSRHVTIQNSFNVGQFSSSITQYDLDSQLKDNGAIIGDSSGTFTLDNVAYFYDLENPEFYLPRAVDLHVDRGATQFNDLASFTEEAFVFDSDWDFATIWTFKSTGYAFPVLRELNYVESNYDLENFAPILYDYFVSSEVRYNPDAEINEIYFFEFYLAVVDIESYGNNLQTVIYAAKDYEVESVDQLPEFTQTVLTFQGFTFEGYDWEGSGISFLPNQGDGNYFFYAYVEDADGLYDFAYLGSIEYESGIVTDDQDAPVPGNNGALTASIDMPREVTLNFTVATDNVSTQENLEYYAYVADTGFDWDAWNLDDEADGILYIEYFNTTSNNVTFQLPFDANFNYRYEVLLLVRDEAGNISAYDPSFFEYID